MRLISSSNSKFPSKNKFHGNQNLSFISKNGFVDKNEQNNFLLNKIKDVMIFHNNGRFTTYSLCNEEEKKEDTKFNSNKNLSNKINPLSPINVNKGAKELSSNNSRKGIISPMKIMDNSNGNVFVYNLKVKDQSEVLAHRMKLLKRNQNSKIMKKRILLTKIDSEENIRKIVNNLKNIFQTNDQMKCKESNPKEEFYFSHKKIIESPFNCLSIDQRQFPNKEKIENNFEENFLKTTYSRKSNSSSLNKYSRKFNY